MKSVGFTWRCYDLFGTQKWYLTCQHLQEASLCVWVQNIDNYKQHSSPIVLVFRFIWVFLVPNIVYGLYGRSFSNSWDNDFESGVFMVT